MNSPYSGLPVEQWKEKTLALIGLHPLKDTEIYGLVMHV